MSLLGNFEDFHSPDVNTGFPTLSKQVSHLEMEIPFRTCTENVNPIPIKKINQMRSNSHVLNFSECSRTPI